jgi:hypothetical protein
MVPMTDEEADACASLIAAGPDLYSALEALVDKAGDSCTCRRRGLAECTYCVLVDEVDEAIKALKRARGEKE